MGKKTGQGGDEIETVLTHEYGHHVHKDLAMGIIVQLILTFFGFWLANIVMNLGLTFFGYKASPTQLPSPSSLSPSASLA